ncbi:MAG: hypothetical protein Q4Q04_01245 [Methanocorpusculum sp.]|nr:hypothetical protein [Methanocorpusculum sp.]
MKKACCFAAGVLIVFALCVFSAGCIVINQSPQPSSVTTQTPGTAPSPAVTPSMTAYAVVGDWEGYLNNKKYSLDCERSGSAKLETETLDIYEIEQKFYGTWSVSGSEYILNLSDGKYTVTVTGTNTATLRTPDGVSVALYREY